MPQTIEDGTDDAFVMYRCEWFKLLLSPESLRSGVPDPWLPPLPVGKNVVDVIADFLRCIWRYAKRTVTEEIGSVVDLSEFSLRTSRILILAYDHLLSLQTLLTYS